MDILASGLRFPEGPVALADGSLLVVEIERQTITRIGPTGHCEVLANVPGGPNGLAMGPDGRVYLCNNGGFAWIRDHGSLRPYLQPDEYRGGSIQRLDLNSGSLETLYESCNGHRLCGPNDLVFDRNGDIWFTDLGKRRAREADRGFVYWARADGSEIREVVGPMVNPNGIGLSPDEKTLYVAETETARLFAFEIGGPGQLRLSPWPAPYGGRLVHGLGGYNRFDSLAVMENGNICVAGLHACAVFEFTPDGARAIHHHAPDLSVTNLCFGGKDMRKAYVTLSHEGKVGVTHWASPGLRLNFQQS